MSELMEVMDDTAEFFAPCSSDVVDNLIAEYQGYRKQIDQVDHMVKNGFRGVLHYFVTGNSTEDRRYSEPSVEQIFAPEGAVFALNAAYWSKAMHLTDVYDCMPQARRDYWNAQLQGKKTVNTGRTNEEVPPLPDFEEDTVRATLRDLLTSRAKFMAERVDGIFRGLSGEHVTNVPEGFSKRMIIGYMLSYGSIRSEKAGLIHDLRAVLAKLMGRDEPKYRSCDVALRQMYNQTGEWNVLDGGALRVRVYKKGTAHLEVHPDMAWRLNQILAALYPTAIPAQFRAKPPKQAKAYQVMQRPLPFRVLELLAHDQRYSEHRTFSFYKPEADAHPAAHQEALSVLLAIGGVLDKNGSVRFDYDYQYALRDIITTGCMPDIKTHQYYPTPEKLARIAVDLAEIRDTDTVLEPSAGQGGIAAFLPIERTTCVEISALHADILKARGFKAVQADFIEWAKTAPQFDRVVMNPPFSEGRAKLHVEVAASLVKSGGRLVAIMPASYKGKDLLPGWACEWSEVFAGEFDGTGVSVVILSGVKS